MFQGRGTSWLSELSCKDTDPTLEHSALVTDRLPKALPPNTIMLGIGFQGVNFEGDPSVRSIKWRVFARTKSNIFIVNVLKN